MALKQTPLHAAHVSVGAKMVDFAGWDMPVFYRSILEEHKAVRRGAGIFDVSHMGEFFITGPDSGAFLNYVFTNEIMSAAPGTAIYTHMLNEKGGVIDDAIVYRLGGGVDMVVVNASRIEDDWAWMKKISERFNVKLTNDSEKWGIIALQGPSARKVGGAIHSRIPALHRFNLGQFTWNSHEMIVASTGYTGEDGFEFIAPNAALTPLWDALMDAAQKENVAPFAACGLGARDTLRLEAGFPLWGHELNLETTPLESGHGWVLKWAKDFSGKEALEEQKKIGVTRKLFGFMGNTPGPIPRAEAVIWTKQGKKAGIVTSGSFSPTLSKPIAMGYVDKEFWAETDFEIEVGGRKLSASVTKLPFYKAVMKE